MELAELKKKKEAQINGIFILMIKIAFIFAIPAVLAALLGTHLDQNGAGLYTMLLLAVALVISWTIVALVYRKQARELKETEDLIKAAQK